MSDISQFQFLPLRMNAPWDNLTTAIGLIQAQILAEETTLSPEVMFGHSHFQRSSLVAAIALLAPLVGETESLRWALD